MTDVVNHAPSSGTDPSAAGSWPRRAGLRTSIHVHATLAAAITEMDTKSRDGSEWLSDRVLEIAAAAALRDLNMADPMPSPGAPASAPSSFPERAQSVDTATAPLVGREEWAKNLESPRG